MGDFVSPKTTRLPLSGGKFIDIRQRLNTGEQEDMYARMSPTFTPGSDTLQFDRREVRISKVLAYLMAWSLTQEDGTPEPYSYLLPEAERLNAIRNLDPDRFLEIYLAIETHEDAMEKARADAKKAQAGSTDSAVTSGSPSAAAGVSAGSAN